MVRRGPDPPQVTYQVTATGIPDQQFMVSVEPTTDFVVDVLTGVEVTVGPDPVLPGNVFEVDVI